MTFTTRAGTLLTLLLLLLAAPASAQQVWQVMAKMGAGGTWAGDCSAGANPSNWLITYYVDKTGVARRLANRGPTESKLNSTIDSSQVLTPTTFLMRIRNDDANWGQNDQMAFDTVIEITPSGMRTLSSIRVGDGTQFIKDGNFTSNGNPATTFQRCK